MELGHGTAQQARTRLAHTGPLQGRLLSLTRYLDWLLLLPPPLCLPASPRPSGRAPGTGRAQIQPRCHRSKLLTRRRPAAGRQFRANLRGESRPPPRASAGCGPPGRAKAPSPPRRCPVAAHTRAPGQREVTTARPRAPAPPSGLSTGPAGLFPRQGQRAPQPAAPRRLLT